jgi:hypothetical protein
MSSRFKPPSEEELARRGIGVKVEKKRARNEDGTLKADDPSTPDVNEAWETVKKVVKRGRPKKKKD